MKILKLTLLMIVLSFFYVVSCLYLSSHINSLTVNLFSVGIITVIMMVIAGLATNKIVIE